MTVPLGPLGKKTYQQAVVLWRDLSPAGREIARKRAATDRLLDQLARSSDQRFQGTVLVDGMWDNPNYWLRYSFLRAALGLAHGREVGLTGQFRRRQVSTTFSALGIRDLISFPDVAVSSAISEQAIRLVSETNNAADVLAWKLPGDVHPTIVYDGILKQQRRATLDVKRADFLPLVIEALTAITRAQATLDQAKPNLVVISHPLNFTYGSLAWLALSRGIPVVLPFGLFGVLRFTRFTQPEDLFAFYDRPTRAEIDDLQSTQADALASIGRQYLAGRMAGRADDLASVFAFRNRSGDIDRSQLCAANGWDPARPIVAFYASNWFDWPHQLGMTQFRDFLDWTEATFAAAKANGGVNWLFKPHPAEDWFGGVALSDILVQLGAPSNIAIAGKQWNNAAVMQSVDAMVTYHGTAGVEFAALGKPVLVPDRGKYDDCGFVRVAKNRADYLSLLGREWWDEMDLAETKRKADIFAGWWFCAPEWQGGFVLSDDAKQDALYDLIPDLIGRNSSTVEREIKSVQDWWHSGHRYYHTSKMREADAFRLTNIG